MKTITAYIENILCKNDRILALLIFLISCLVAFFIHDVKILLIALTNIIICILYLVLNINFNSTLMDEKSFYSSTGSTILFINILSYIFYILYSSLYQRPIVYFIAMSILCGVIALEILVLKEETGLQSISILLKIISVAAIARLSIIYLNPGLIGGGDPWYHTNFASSIIETGHVPTGMLYTYYPIMQIQLAITQIIGSLTSKDALTISIGLPEIFSIVFIYLLGKSIFNTKVGLFSALIVSISSFHIYRGIVLQSMTMGLVFFSILMYLSYIDKKKSHFEFKVLFLIFAFTLVLTHIIVPVIFTIILIILYFCLNVNTKCLVKDSKSIIKGNSILVFIVMLFSYWLYTSLGHEQSVFQYAIYNLKVSLVSEGISPTAYIGNTFNSPIIDQMLSNASFILILGLSVLGSLIIFKSKIEKPKLSLVINSYLLFILIGILGFRGDTNMLPERWLPFVSLFIAILASYGLFSISNCTNRRTKIYFILTLVILISFLNLTNSQSNIDRPLYLKNETIRTAFYTSELNAANFSAKRCKQIVITDPILIQPLKYHYKKDADVIYDKFIKASKLNDTDIYLIRDYIYHSYVFTAYNPYKIDSLFLNQLTTNKSIIYTNGKDKLYISGENN